MKKHSFRWNLVALSVASICSGTVLAAENDDQEKAKKEGVPTITVTARRTTENLQEVPVAVTAINDVDLEIAGVEMITEVQQFSPNTTLQRSRGTNSTMTAFIRGVGQQDPLWGYEPGVGIYVDDVYIARPQGAVLDILNVERVEVLRGPQGTLYGKNTVGGAVKYVTKEMSGDAEFAADLALGSFNQRDVKLTGQVPVSDNFYIGFGAANLQRDGYGEYLESDLPNQDRENYNKDVEAFRLTFEFRPIESVFLQLKWDQTEDRSNAKGGYRLLPSLLTNAPVPNSVYDSYTSLPTWNKVDVEGVSFVAEWELSAESALKYVYAKRENFSPTNIDFDNTPLRIFDVPAFYDDEQWSHELQFNHVTDTFKFVSGLYSFSNDSCGQFDAILEVFGNALTLPGLTREISGCSYSDSYAAYAQGSFDLNEQWSMTLGGRYTEEKRAAVVNNGLLFETVYPWSGWVDGYIRPDGNLVPQVLNDEETWTKFTPRIGFEYQHNADVMFFFSYAEGFKSGTFNPRAATAEPAADPENVNSFEIGMKSDWGDNFRANVTLFSLEHKDRQYVSVLPSADLSQLNQRLGNIGVSEATGLEAELTYAASDDLMLTATFGYIDADFKEVIDTDPNTGDPFDKSDRFTISNTPKYTMNLGANYTIESSFGDFVLNSTYYYRDDYVLFEEDSLLTQDGYGLFNVSLSWYSNTSNWNAGLHIKNLTDEEYMIGGYQFVTPDPSDPTDISLYQPGLGGDTTLIGYFGDPRTITLTIGYDF